MTAQPTPNLSAVSVIMPTFKQANFIRRAIDSLLMQVMPHWDLWIIDDGSPDDTAERVAPYLSDARIHYVRLEQNGGLGAALNEGLDRSPAPYVAYLPSDDVYYPDHLASLLDCLRANPQASMVFSGVRHHYNRMATGQIEGYPLQLVQVMHRRGKERRWMERAELVTDDLERMLWASLREDGEVLSTGQITCEWVDHPRQGHKILREPVGGINPYRQYYGVREPIRIHTTAGNFMDEAAHYRRYRERPDTPQAADGLKILLVGELAYNADRVLALEERGHKLYGLWMPEPYWYNAVGPLAFGHVQDLDPANWQEEVRRIQPDVIYALLNWQAVPFVHSVMKANPGVPLVWHFKEGPFISLEKGHWDLLVDLYRESDGLIYTSPEMQEWFETVLPELKDRVPALVLDGDLPKRDWFEGERSPRLSKRSEGRGGFHTVVPGRPIGLHPHNVAELAAQDIHLHFYGDFTHHQWLAWIEKTRSLAPNHIHLHAQVDQEDWVREFSQYDAGWLHYFRSENRGEIRRSNWDDLNYPARIATLAVAGLPVLQRDNTGSTVATQTLARKMDIGLFFRSMEELRAELSNTERLEQVRANVWRQREQFTMDAHVERLITFFREVMARR